MVMFIQSQKSEIVTMKMVMEAGCGVRERRESEQRKSPFSSLAKIILFLLEICNTAGVVR